jgi:glycosyltransferase involved in cell wall biosynthesis
VTRTLLLTAQQLDTWRVKFGHQHTPSALPYGVDVLEKHQFSFVGGERRGGNHPGKLRNLVEHRTGFPVVRPLSWLAEARRVDLVLALLEREAYLPALLKAKGWTGYAKKPLVIWSCWLADEVTRSDAAARAVLKKRVTAADLVIHLSRHETPILQAELGLRRDQLFAMTYGVSHRYYQPTEHHRDIPVLAVGQDRGRDYATLLAAIRDTDLQVDLVCRRENLGSLDLPKNVNFRGTVSLSEYRDLLARAQIVAVPTLEMAYPSGSSVALEAAASGCAVVTTTTTAMTDYFTDQETARLVAVGDVETWRTVLTELLADPAQRQQLGAAARLSVETRFNADQMWCEIAQVLGDRGIISHHESKE